MAAVANDGEPDGGCVEERETGGDETKNTNDNGTIMGMSRKEKRKALKKMKRKQLRREMAMKEREEEEARLNDPEEQMRLLRLEQEEAERMERDRMEFEEREKRFLEELELKKKKEEEEEEQPRKLSEESRAKLGDNENANGLDEDDDWEYVEEGPAEIIWKGNEIIVKKKKVRVPKKTLDPQNIKQESDRPTSNPLAPQTEAFEEYKSAQEVLDSVAQQVPNFGTEQDKAHCPFHLKTGVCRFGARCSRVHFYPDKSCTLLMKNMYTGPGLAWEQDEGLEFTDEEVERSFVDFYEDVHTEFLKFGEIVNFKVCKNSSSHLRGNVYVHYKSLESAVLAYQSINGRYFAGKQISCEFVNLTRWKVAICGEYMKSRLKTCSRGSVCNFIHCFRNPGGDYEWADWDKPAPRYWLKKMAALFGYTADRRADEVSPGCGLRRSRSRGPDSAHGKDEDYDWKRECHRKHRGGNRKRVTGLKEEMDEERMGSQRYHLSNHRKSDDISDGSSDEQKSFAHKRRSRKRDRDAELTGRDSKIRKHEDDSGQKESVRKGESDRYLERNSRSSRRHKRVGELSHDHSCSGKVDEFDPRENSDADRHRDKYHSHKSKHSLHRKEDTDSSDIDSYGDILDKDKHRHHRRSKRSSRHTKYEADFSDSASDRDVSRNKIRHQKNGRRNSRSKNESDFVDIGSSRERLYRDEHGRRSSMQHGENTGFSNINSDAFKYHRDEDSPEEKDNLSASQNFGNGSKHSSHGGSEAEEDNRRYNVEHRLEINERNEETTSSQMVKSGATCPEIYGESESECEWAYRLAALKRLEEMRKSKDSQSVHNGRHVESARTLSHDNNGLAKGKEVSKGPEEVLHSSKVETSPASTKRRRI